METMSITHAASFISLSVASAAAGRCTNKSDQPKSRMSITESKNRSTIIVATEAVSEVRSRRAIQSGRTSSPGRPRTKIAENPTTVAVISGPIGIGLSGFNRICHRKARVT